MEPDVPLLARAPQGLPRAHAGDHRVGPAKSAGRGERFPWRGGFTVHYDGKSTFGKNYTSFEIICFRDFVMIRVPTLEL